MLPESCGMPDLSDLHRLNLRMLSLMFGSAVEPVTHSQRLHLLRLVDRAILDYLQARAGVLAQIAERQRPVEELTNGRQIYMFGVFDALESCVITTRRALRFLDRLAQSQDALPIPRDLRRFVTATAKPIVDFRNALEHLDEGIREEAIEAGVPIVIVLDPRTETISIGSAQLRVQTLASVLRKLHAVVIAQLEVPPHMLPPGYPGN